MKRGGKLSPPSALQRFDSWEKEMLWVVRRDAFPSFLPAFTL